MCVLSEAAGAAALPVPLAVVAAATWCEQRCSDGVALVLDRADAKVDVDRVSGRWPAVPFAGVAEKLLVLGRREGDAVLGVVQVVVYTGAVMMLFADVVGRLIARPGELQVGIILAFVGAPFFIALIYRRRVVAI